MATRQQTPSFATIVNALEYRARHASEDLAFAIEGEELTYGALWQEALRIAASLSAAGVGAGDRCALILPTSLGFLKLLFAIQILRAIPIPFNARLPAILIARRLARFKVDLAVCADAMVDALETAAAAESRTRLTTLSGLPAGSSLPEGTYPGPRDTAYVQITSGTTGEPKGAVVAHDSLVACIKGCIERQEAYDTDILITWVPLFHDLGLVKFVFLPLYLGSPAYLLEPSIANFGRWLELISEVRGTVSGAPDFGYRIAARMVDPTRVDLGSLRVSSNGGEPPRQSTIDSFESRYGIPGVIRPGYGLAETTLTVAMSAPGEEVRVDGNGTVSCGRPVSGSEVAVVDGAGHQLAAGERGEIVVRGAQVFDGYLDDEAATDEVFLPDRWLKTGDIGYIDGDGFVFVLGRRRAMIKHAGSAIPPREIEEAVDLVKGVRFSAVVGVQDHAAHDTEKPVVVAEVRTGEGGDSVDLNALCRRISVTVQETIGFVPWDVLLVEPRTIHRTENGKIRHWRLQQAVEDGELENDGKILRRQSDSFQT